MEINRRTLLQTGLSCGLGMGLVSGGVASAKSARMNTLADLTPEQRLRAYIRLIGTLEDAVRYTSFAGTLWGVAPDKLPLPVCGFQSIARQQWSTDQQGGFVIKSFDVGFFSDLETGEPLDSLVNPITGETVKPFHYKYGGSAIRYSVAGTQNVAANGELSELKAYDLDWTALGKQVWVTDGGQGEIDSPLDPKQWPRESAGEKVRYAGETSYSGPAEQLFNDDLMQADSTLYWSSIAPWEPWLLMNGAPGSVLWRAIGTKLDDPLTAPPQMLKFIEQQQSNYFAQADPWQGYLSNFSRFKNARSPAK